MAKIRRTRTETMFLKMSRIPGNYWKENQIFNHNNITYKIITGSMYNFYGNHEWLISIGAGVNRRELLTVNSEMFRPYYDELLNFLFNCQPTWDKSSDVIWNKLHEVGNYARSKLIGTDIEPIRQAANENSLFHILDHNAKPLPIIPLSHFIEKGQGVCRHFSLFTVYLLGYLINNTILPSGKVFIYRDDIKVETEMRAHSWIIYMAQQQEETIFYSVDPAWNNKVYSLTTQESLLVSQYGAEVVERMKRRVENLSNSQIKKTISPHLKRTYSVYHFPNSKFWYELNSYESSTSNEVDSEVTDDLLPINDSNKRRKFEKPGY